MDANQIQNLFASNVRQLLVDADLDYDKLYEIRLRVGRPLFLTYDGGECFLRQKDTEPYLVTREDLKETLEYVSGYSLYAYEDEIRQGFLSVQGGHRVGVTGKVILDGNRIRGMKYISCINVRLAHEIQGCAEEVLPYIQTREQIMHTLIVSPPRCGKTTLLRDIIRQMSNGWGNISGVTVGVVDERSELAGCYQGIPQNDLGMRTDILDGCPKAEGMQMLIRSMSPVVVAVDELGKEEDFKAVESVIHCGCRLIATAHGASMEETLSQPFFRKLWEARVFQRYIFLGKHERAGIVEGIYDENGKCTSVCDVAIVEYLMDTEDVFVIDGIAFVYENGVFKEDANGIVLMNKIQACLYRNEIKAATIKRVYDLLIRQQALQISI